MKRRFLAILVGVGLGLVVPPAMASADDLTLVTVDCGDGSPLQATVDLATLDQLQASIQGMTENPAGLSCTLSTSPIATPPPLPLAGGTAYAAAQSGFIVGGGRWARSDGCGINFNISAHIESDGSFRGSLGFAINNASPCVQGSVKANVTCIDVFANTAEIKGDVNQATGSLSGDAGTVIFTDLQDNGQPSSTPRDNIFQGTDPSQSDRTCAATSGAFSVDNGNISIHS